MCVLAGQGGDAQLCPALCDPMDSSQPGSSVHVFKGDFKRKFTMLLFTINFKKNCLSRFKTLLELK